MPRLESSLVPVVTDLARGLRALNVPFAVVGALVPELLLSARPDRMTYDADVAVIVQSLAAFETLKHQLSDFRFASTTVRHRLRHRSGGLVDLLPFSPSIAPGGRLGLEPDLVLTMAGYEHVVPSAVEVAIDDGPTLPVVPLPLYVLLKLIAFHDRKAPKDLAGVFHCLRHYLDDDDRRYEAEHNGHGVPFEYTGAYLLGVDGRRFLDTAVCDTVGAVLDRFAAPDADGIFMVSTERGRTAPGEDARDVFDHFRWFRRGLGL